LKDKFSKLPKDQLPDNNPQPTETPKSLDIDITLIDFNNIKYPYQHLVTRPNGLDLENLEKYLTDNEFELIFNTTMENFESLPPWKKQHLKKLANLF